MPKKGARGQTYAPPEQQIKVIERYIGEGLKPERACLAAGISRATYYNWKRLGRNGENSEYRAFLDRCMTADAQGELWFARIIRKHSSEDAPGKAAPAMFALSHRYHESWGVKQSVELEVEAKLPAEVLRELREGFFGVGQDDETSATIQEPGDE